MEPPPLGGNWKWDRRGGQNRDVVRKEHNVAASGTFGKVRKTLGALVFWQHAIDKGAKRIRVEM